MPLHLLKLCVGCDSIRDLEDWIEENQTLHRRLGRAYEQTHTTRMVPKRMGEIVEGGSVKAPMHGKLIALFVQPGDRVEKGQRLAIVEAMKMEHALVAPADGEVAEVAAEVGSQVAEGARLIVVKADGE